MTPENLTDENTLVEVVNSEIVFQQNKAEIDIQIATAHAYPRNVSKAIENAIAIVTMDEETAKTCNYSLSRGGDNISGPSVHLAKILAQNWGNMRIDAKVIDIGQKQITSQAVAFDLENNLAIRVEVKRSIWGKKGRFNDDMITMTGNASNAIALRNAVFAVVPRGVVNRAYNAAKAKITGDLSDEQKLIAKRKQVLDSLKDTYEVTEKEALTAVGKVAVKHLTADDILVLIGLGQAIKDGDTTVEQAFKAPSIKEEKKTTQTEKIKKATAGTPAEELVKKIEACKDQDELDVLYSATPDEQKTQEILDLFQKRKF